MHACMPVSQLTRAPAEAETAFPVVDWNPSGLLIYSTYKYGSRAARQQSPAQHALPGLQLLAVRGEMLQGVPQHVLQAIASYPSCFNPLI